MYTRESRRLAYTHDKRITPLALSHRCCYHNTVNIVASRGCPQCCCHRRTRITTVPSSVTATANPVTSHRSASPAHIAHRSVNTADRPYNSTVLSYIVTNRSVAAYRNTVHRSSVHYTSSLRNTVPGRPVARSFSPGSSTGLSVNTGRHRAFRSVTGSVPPSGYRRVPRSPGHRVRSQLTVHINITTGVPFRVPGNRPHTVVNPTIMLNKNTLLCIMLPPVRLRSPSGLLGSYRPSFTGTPCSTIQLRAPIGAGRSADRSPQSGVRQSAVSRNNNTTGRALAPAIAVNRSLFQSSTHSSLLTGRSPRYRHQRCSTTGLSLSTGPAAFINHRVNTTGCRRPALPLQSTTPPPYRQQQSGYNNWSPSGYRSPPRSHSHHHHNTVNRSSTNTNNTVTAVKSFRADRAWSSGCSVGST